MLTVVQRREPAVTKELCLVTLTKIFTLLQGYQTLIREIATPHLQPFAQACLQILKPPASSKAAKPSLDFVESIFEAISTLLPLYPTTLRPSAVQFRSAAKSFLAPTTSDGIFVPRSLQESSQRLVVRLHMTAAKGGGVEEWTKHTNGLIKSFHETADQVLRAVHENWESTTGYTPQHVDLNGAPHGGDDSADQLPPWTGVEAGSERMIGLLRFLGNCLQCGTKTPVTIPVSHIFDIAMRIASIVPPNQGRDKSGATQTNAAIGREEKEELWAVFPEIQIATLELLQVVMRRLERSYTPMAPETLDLALRIFESGYRIPELRVSVFTITKQLLVLSGPTLAKTNVEALSLVTKACCRDLLGNAGHLKVPKPQAALQGGGKAKTLTQNADAFLVGNKDEETLQVTLMAEHVAAAEELLVVLFNRLPQQYINSSLRAQMLKVAILCQIKDAQVASVLHPSRDRSGRMPQVILPYLHRQFPHDETIEILRFNYRPMTANVRAGMVDAYDDMEADDVSMEEPADGFAFDKPFEASTAKPQEEDVHMAEEEATVTVTATKPIPTPAPIQASPFLAQPVPAVEVAAEATAAAKPATRATRANTRKRKSDEAAEAAAKRVELEDTAKKPEDDKDPGFAPVGMLVESSLQPKAGAGDEAGDGDSDDESVHLNMELNSDDDDDDEEDE